MNLISLLEKPEQMIHMWPSIVDVHRVSDARVAQEL